MDIKLMFYQIFPVKEKIQMLLDKVQADESAKAQFEQRVIEVILMKFLEAVEKSMDDGEKSYVETLANEYQGQDDKKDEFLARFQNVFKQPKFKEVYEQFVREGIDQVLVEMEEQATRTQ